MGISIADATVMWLVALESLFSIFLRLIPHKVIKLVVWMISGYEMDAESEKESDIEMQLRLAPTIHDMCKLFEVEVEDHLVRTEDDYILTLHRIRAKPGTFNGKVAYLHHGLLMCSDVWVCNVKRDNNLPFVLHDLGFDVWMGNNRGNKYSTTHLTKLPISSEFWDFSIDEFAFFDIPNSVEFVLDRTTVDQLICIGFSQGSAQMFAAFSISEELNRKVSQFIAISPAMTPQGLHNRVFDLLAKSSPSFMHLIFGNKVLLPTAVMGHKALPPSVFNRIIDFGCRELFNWRTRNISHSQKMISYSKLYSTTSVKCVVHWFQILRAQKFQMFEEEEGFISSIERPYKTASFPTRTNIKIPILLIYGSNDSLVDIDVMKENLPSRRVFDIEVENYEHLDLIWGWKINSLVISNIIKFIDFFDHSLPLLEEVSSSSPLFSTFKIEDDCDTLSLGEGLSPREDDDTF